MLFPPENSLHWTNTLHELFPSDTHFTAYSMEVVQIKCLAQRHNILMQSGFKPSIAISRNRHLTYITNMLHSSRESDIWNLMLSANKWCITQYESIIADKAMMYTGIKTWKKFKPEAHLSIRACQRMYVLENKLLWLAKCDKKKFKTMQVNQKSVWRCWVKINWSIVSKPKKIIK